MAPLFLGLAVLVAVMLLGRWFAAAPPAQMLRTAKWTGVAVLLGGGLLLLISGRAAWLGAAVIGLLPWAGRAWRHGGVWRLARGLRDGLRGDSHGRKGPGGHSRVRTRFLDMRLEHESGTLWGEVLDGPWRGRKLSDLSFDEVLALRRFCAGDGQSLQLLEAWLDRGRPDWREQAEARETAEAAPRPAAAMTREEAYEVLGLAPGAGPDAIKAAHRRLMAVAHPDHGGSNYLAARINQAKDILIGG